MIELRGADELIAKLEGLNKLSFLPYQLRAAAMYLKGKLAKYPQQRHGLTRESVYGAPFQNDDQRKAFFAGLKSGEIEVPYHRGEAEKSERLGQSWTVEAQDGGLTQVIGNDTSYGPLVMGSYDQGEQAEFMHQMGWTPYDQVVEQYEDFVNEKVTSAIDKFLES